MLDKFKFPFDGIEDIEQNYSQCFQDMFCLAVHNGKRNGTFLEIGAFHSSFLSNTLLLERDFGWHGVSIDIEKNAQQDFAHSGRTAKFILGNALELDYRKILRENFEENVVDYLQIDIEPNINSLDCLKRIPFDKYKFGYVDFETDYYDPNTPQEINDYVRNESRRILKENNYILVAGNISNIDQNPMEEWYINADIFPECHINKFKRTEDTTLPSHKYMLDVE